MRDYDRLSCAEGLGSDPARDRLHRPESRDGFGGVPGELLFPRTLANRRVVSDFWVLSVF